MTITVDAKRCIGCGMCAAAVPGVFAVEGGVSVVKSQPEGAQARRAFDAANGCPVNAIRIKRGAETSKRGRRKCVSPALFQSSTRKSPRAAASARRRLSWARASSMPPMIWLDTRNPLGVRCQRPSSSQA